MSTRSRTPRNSEAGNIRRNTNNAGELPTKSSIVKERPADELPYVNFEELAGLPRQSDFDRNLFPQDGRGSSEPRSSDDRPREPKSGAKSSREELGGISEFSLRQASGPQEVEQQETEREEAEQQEVSQRAGVTEKVGNSEPGTSEQSVFSRRRTVVGESGEQRRSLRNTEQEVPRTTRKPSRSKKSGDATNNADKR